MTCFIPRKKLWKLSFIAEISLIYKMAENSANSTYSLHWNTKVVVHCDRFDHNFDLMKALLWNNSKIAFSY